MDCKHWGSSCVTWSACRHRTPGLHHWSHPCWNDSWRTGWCTDQTLSTTVRIFQQSWWFKKKFLELRSLLKLLIDWASEIFWNAISNSSEAIYVFTFYLSILNNKGSLSRKRHDMTSVECERENMQNSTKAWYHILIFPLLGELALVYGR